MNTKLLLTIVAVAVALVLPGIAVAQDDPPPVEPEAPILPAEPVPDVPASELTQATPVPEPEPEPIPEPEPEEVAVEQQVLASFQLVTDTVSLHDRGAADMTEADAEVIAASAALTRAEQRQEDISAERRGSAISIIQAARAAISVLETLILEYSPAQ